MANKLRWDDLRGKLTEAVGWGLTAIACFAAFMRFQWPSTELDGDYQVYINHAFRTGAVFGRDVVFTYGPTAFLEFPIFHPDLLGWKITALAILSAVFASVVWKMARDAHAPLFVMSSLVVAALLVDFGPAIYALVVLLCPFFFLRCKPTPGVMLGAIIPVMVVFAFTKFTMFAMCIGLMATITLMGVVEREWRLSLLLPGFILLAGFAWVLWFGDLGSALEFIHGSLAVSDGFNKAMQWPGPIHEVMLVSAGVFVLILIAIYVTRGLGRKVCHALALLFIFYILHKHAFVRHDAHARLATGGLAFASVVYACRLWWGSSKALKSCLIVLGLYALGVVDHTERRYRGHSVFKTASEVFSRGLQSIHYTHEFVSGRTDFKAEYAKHMADVREKHPLPTLDGTVDIYPIGQTVLLAHEADLLVRPVFHSYSAYTPELLRLNAGHLQKNKPGFLLFALDHLDGRYPAMHESLSWPEILSSYELESRLPSHLLLKRREIPLTVRTQPISRLIGRMNNDVELPKTPGMVWARIVVRPSASGWIRGFVYKPGSIVMHLHAQSGAVYSNRFSTEIARSGFVVSPIVLDEDAFGRLLAPSAAYSSGMDSATSLRLEPDQGTEWAWVEEYTIELEQLIVE